MTYEYFKQHWQDECLKDGVLTIPEGIEELCHDCGIQGNQNVKKVIFPQSGRLNIYGPVFQDCKNLEEVENFPPVFKCQEEFIDEDAGKLITIDRTVECKVNESVFYGCTKLFVNEREIDEDGYMTVVVNGKTYSLGYHEDSEDFMLSKMSRVVDFQYRLFFKRHAGENEEALQDKTKFSFRKTLRRFGKEWEYLFENGALYNVTKSTFVLYLSEFSNGDVVVPEWVKSFDLVTDPILQDDEYISTFGQLDMIGLHFLGNTALENLHSVQFPNLKKLVFSSFHEVIPGSCFRFCPKLKEIVFPDTLKRIGGGSFTSCKYVETLEFPTSLEIIEDNSPGESCSFWGCSSLREITFNVGNDLIIGDSFGACHHLRHVHIKNVDQASHTCHIRGFWSCDNLSFINVTEVDCTIEEGAFFHCDSLQKLNGVSDDYHIHGGGLFYKDHLLSSLNYTELRYPDNAELLFETTGYVKTLYLPSGIKSIEDQPEDAMGYESEWEPAYMRAENIIVPVGYKDYYINLFCDDYEKNESHYHCFGDKYKDVRETLKAIIKEGVYTSVSEDIIPNECVFLGTRGHSSVVIPESMKIIGSYAFDGFKELTSLQIPDSITEIREDAFARCYGLTAIELPNSIKRIGQFAFYCSGLGSIKVPNAVKQIERLTFHGCNNLKSVELPKSLTSIGSAAFENCVNLTSIEIPTAVTLIGQNAFRNCERLTSVIINSSLTQIEESAFIFCKSLSHLEIRGSVSEIGTAAFGQCESLSAITIPDTVVSIGSEAFYNCNSLREIHCHIKNLNTVDIANDAFTLCNFEECILYVPDGAEEKYRTHPVFSQFVNICNETQ